MRFPRPSFGPTLTVIGIATAAIILLGMVTLNAFRNGNWVITIGAGAVIALLYACIGVVNYRYQREQVRRGRWWPLWKK